MPEELFVIVDEEEEERKPMKIPVRNNSKFITCANLDTYDGKGQRESVIWGPRGRDDTRELTHAQLGSKEVGKLITRRVLEIRR